MDIAALVAGALEQCDVACLLYDSSDPKSFSTAASMLVSPLGITNHPFRLQFVVMIVF